MTCTPLNVSISRNTYYKYTQSENKLAEQPQKITKSEESANTSITKIMKVELWLQVENNSKFVRGKGKVRNEIEQFILSQFAMEKLDKNNGRYILSIPYTSDEELDNIIGC